MKLEIGMAAPDFCEIIESGEQVQLSDFKGKKLVLYFYPKDNTPTCTVQACELRDNYQHLLDNGYAILGISPDSAKKHQNFINKFDLPFSLIADTDKTMIENYGVWGEKNNFGRTYMGVNRTTFVVDEEGKIEKIISKVIAKSHSEQIVSL